MQTLPKELFLLRVAIDAQGYPAVLANIAANGKEKRREFNSE